MGNHIHGAPDNQEENLDDILGRGKGDFDMWSGKFIGEDLPDVEHVMDQTHWSDLPTPTGQFEPTDWYASDNSPESPLEADWDDVEDDKK